MPIKFLNTLQVDSDVLYVDASSNKVGIGTTTPNFKVSLLSDNGDNNIVATDLITGNFKIGHGYDPFGSSPLNVTSKIQFVTSAPPGYYGDDIIFSTTPYALGPIGGDASSERMRITAEGNVGIGTTSPYAKLDVSGNISLSGTGTRSIVYDGFFVLSSFNPASFDFLYANNNLIANPITGFLTWQGSPILYGNINTGSIPAQGVIGMDNSGIITEFPASEAIRIDSSGNVGIGTTNPVHKLHVVSSEQCPALFQSSVAGGGISLMDSTTADDTRVGIGAFGEHLCFRSGGAPAGNMRLTSDGKLGIGTTSPASKLHAYESSSNTNATAGITVEQAGSGDAVVQYLLSFQKRWVTGIDNSDSDKFKISQDTDLGVNTVMTFDSSSRVGIGTTTPSDRLEVAAPYSQLRLTDTDDGKFTQFSYSSGKLVVRNNSTTTTTNQFTLDLDGKMGIGTTSPAYKLDVSGTGAFSGTLYTNINGSGIAGIIGKSAANQWASRYDSNNSNFSGFYFDSNNHSIIVGRNSSGVITNYINSSGNSYFNGGNIGIGTTNPQTGLHLYETSANATVGGADKSVLRLTNTYGGAFGSGGEIQFGVHPSTNGSSVLSAIKGAYTSYSSSNYGGALDFYTRNADGLGLKNRMRITAGGNVGIGTTSPLWALHVQSDETDGALAIARASNTDQRLLLRGGTGSGDARVASTYHLELKAGLSGNTAYDLTLSTALGTAMTVDAGNSNNIGIGTTAPSVKLDVVSSSSGTYSNALKLHNASDSVNTATGIRLQTAASTSANSYSEIRGVRTNFPINGGHALTFHTTATTSGSAYERMRIDGAGNVGIATISPSYRLDVSGNARVTGDFRCDTLIQTSDADLKDNIRDISKDKSNIRFKEYTLKNDTSGKKKYGVLADDIRNDYPELVHYNAEGQAGVDYISLLVKKVAELEASEKTMLTWRHYIGNTSYNTLYDSGATTAFPYAYSSIPAPYDMYLTSVTMINNPYSSYNKGPLGGKAQLLAYENGKFIDKIEGVNYRQEPYASVTFDFADKVLIKQGNALQLRFQADGNWYYCNSTIILTKA
jgi:hypothetical protein